MPKPLPADTWNHLFYPAAEYRYFENAEHFPFEPEATGFSWHNAWWLADAAVLAYVKDWNAVQAILAGAGFGHAEQFGTAAEISTKGFLAIHTGDAPFAVVSFRGTDKDDDRTAASDVRTLPVERDGCTVHQGFLEALDQVWASEVEPRLTAFHSENPAVPVYFTGHSLGAALATIAVTRYQGRSGLYTIGSPRVGDDRFVRAVLQRTALVFRFVNSQDIVTQVPPEVPLQHFYRHVGVERYIDRNGVIHEHPSDFDKAMDVARGVIGHDGAAALSHIGNPAVFWTSLKNSAPFIDPPPYIVGNHSPNRYPIHIWNHHSGL